MATRNYSATSVATTIAGAISNSATTFSISAASGMPSAPFIVIVDRDLPTEEVMLVGSLVGTTCSSVTRGYDGTSAVAHSAGATFEHGVSAIDFREANQHVNATSGIHGLTGAFVGTSDIQTLTNKTLTSPTINTPAITGGTVSNASITGGTVNPTTLQQSGAAVATQTGAETLTNKTLTSPTVNGGTVNATTLQKGGVNVDTVSEVATLTNKTLTSPTINAGALSGTLSGSPTFSGDPSFTGTPSFTNSPTSPANGPYAAWQSYTPSILGGSSIVGSYAYVKVGKVLYVRGSVTSGTATLATVAFGLPGGLSPAVSNSVAHCINTNGAWTTVPCQVRSNGVEFNKASGTNFGAGDSVAGYVFSAVIEVS